RLPGVAELAAMGGAYAREARRMVTVSYVLLAGVNDSPAEARALAALVAPHGLHVNLIPVNEVEELGYRPPSRAAVSEFVSVLLDAKVPTHVRATRGAESNAACGQLRRRPRSAT
ncbi:MAG TPA: 23S rRNA (adenine(2503)-C(2))-methyltransferase RlmN, partial [Planctomycetes bacterium]|nr:23S rRNA (adenine(2503)-C(2))-methyltransferase RlmN [Planctomycetota bacterium]